MNVRAVLIAMGKAGVLTPERSNYVRLYPENMVQLYLVQQHMPAEVLVAAGLPPITFNARARVKRLSPALVQTAVDTHLALLGLDMVPVAYVHPNIAERWDLHRDWLLCLNGARSTWTAGLSLPVRVARVLEFGTRMAVRPLVPLIEAGIHPYGLDASGERFLCVNTHVDHDAIFREWDAENLSAERDL